MSFSNDGAAMEIPMPARKPKMPVPTTGDRIRLMTQLCAETGVPHLQMIRALERIGAILAPDPEAKP